MNNRYLTKIAEANAEYSPHYLRNAALTGAAAGGFHMITDEDMANRHLRNAKENYRSSTQSEGYHRDDLRRAYEKLKGWDDRQGYHQGKAYAEMDPYELEEAGRHHRVEVNYQQSHLNNAIERTKEHKELFNSAYRDVEQKAAKTKKITLIGAGVGLAATGANHLRHKWMDKHE